MRFGVVVFPGSDEREIIDGLKESLGEDVGYIWHRDESFSGYDAVILPGGSSFGHYLRPGALASHSPVMEKVVEFAKKGGPVLGISNGFQILLEKGFFPGTFLPNESLQYRCGLSRLEVVRKDTPFTALYEEGEEITLPLAQRYGRYSVSAKDLEILENNRQIVLRYKKNLDGSTGAIAGLVNENGNVFGIMARPERAIQGILGGTDGRKIFLSLKGGLK